MFGSTCAQISRLTRLAVCLANLVPKRAVPRKVKSEYELCKDNLMAVNKSGMLLQLDASASRFGSALSDHKGGVLLLSLVVILQSTFDGAARRLATDIGGSKRLHALSTCLSAVCLSPLLFIQLELPSLSIVLTAAKFGVLLFVIDYYVDGTCAQKLSPLLTTRLGTTVSDFTAIFLSWLWQRESTDHEQATDSFEYHQLTGGVILAFFLFFYATIVESRERARQQTSLVGYTSTGKPLYSKLKVRDHLHQHHPQSTSWVSVTRSGLRTVLEDKHLRNVLFYLCLNLAFTFVEMAYGVWNNSLGLVSDGFHMLFDSSALAFGLVASIVAKWKPTRTFSLGYGRVNVLSAFVNGLFLLVIAMVIFTEAVSRILNPPNIVPDKLLVISIAGLVVNLIGLVCIGHHHQHQHYHDSHNHQSKHAHSHYNVNLQDFFMLYLPYCNTLNLFSSRLTDIGIFLHVIADTLGSVGVILSSFLVEYFGFTLADPVCSFFISIIIFLSALPLVRSTAVILLLAIPHENVQSLRKMLPKIEGVISYRNICLWNHSPDVMCGTAKVHVTADSNEQRIIAQATSAFQNVGATKVSIQVEKGDFPLETSEFSMNKSSQTPLQCNHDFPKKVECM